MGTYKNTMGTAIFPLKLLPAPPGHPGPRLDPKMQTHSGAYSQGPSAGRQNRVPRSTHSLGMEAYSKGGKYRVGVASADNAAFWCCLLLLAAGCWLLAAGCCCRCRHADDTLHRTHHSKRPRQNQRLRPRTECAKPKTQARKLGVESSRSEAAERTQEAPYQHQRGTQAHRV